MVSELVLGLVTTLHDGDGRRLPSELRKQISNVVPAIEKVHARFLPARPPPTRARPHAGLGARLRLSHPYHAPTPRTPLLAPRRGSTGGEAAR